MDNRFIELTEKVYDAKIKYNSGHDERFRENKENNTVVESKKQSWLDSLFKKKEEPAPVAVPPDLAFYQSAYNELKTFFNNILSNPSQTFWTLWQICQFVRWAEKLFFYKNNPDEPYSIFVDSEMNAEERNFKVSGDGVCIFISLKLVKKPKASFAEKQYNEVISIKVERDFGKKMENKINITNENTDNLDDSDLYLITQINRYIHFGLRNLFYTILMRVAGDLCCLEDTGLDRGYYI